MAKIILVPQVGQDLTEGKILEINVKVGDKVEKGDIVAAVESEKAAFEVEAFAAGTVLKICYEVGDWGTVLEPLMYVGEEGESIEASGSDASGAGTDAVATESNTTPADVSGDVIAVGGKLRSSPLARRIAQINGLDLSLIKGTGPRGAIVKRDVEAVKTMEVATSAVALASAAAAPALVQPTAIPVPALERSDREIPHSRMRQIIADRLLHSKQNVPHFYLQAEVDVTETLTARKAFNEKTGLKVTINDILVRCVALTLMEFPQVNSHVTPNSVIQKGDINVGVAVSVPDGLMVPVVANADKLDLLQISKESKKLAESARRGISASREPGTFSISNVGMFGVDVLPIINPPEAAILGVGKTTEQLRPFKGGIFTRQIMSLSLSVDHRAVDGALAAQFLSRLTDVIAEYTPEGVV
ncbi:MAG: 2-oxo acid dehydrogenase subunit E2 [Marinovum sp.]|jgi:pyruvate dehydrogenase E2 component (dihydrolipoamide acetyltransferase)|nr:2-oxo acid dehydrogenase subunit E2 [Marinovum sp.]MBT6526796.1 2-oxo acid dehydrogenase subunit E2 [Marinovum sp.]